MAMEGKDNVRASRRGFLKLGATSGGNIRYHSRPTIQRKGNAETETAISKITKHGGHTGVDQRQ